MNTQPRLEARVGALERRQITLDAQIEELAQDTNASLKHLTDDMKNSFDQLTEYLAKNEEKAEERFTKIEADITNIKATLKQHTTLLMEILTRLPKPQP